MLRFFKNRIFATNIVRPTMPIYVRCPEIFATSLKQCCLNNNKKTITIMKVDNVP